MNLNPFKLLMAALCAMSLTGCLSGTQSQSGIVADDELNRCINLAQKFGNAVHKSKSSNAAGQYLNHYPFLASNRFLDELALDLTNDELRQQWVQKASAFAMDLAHWENMTLPNPWPAADLQKLQLCGVQLANRTQYEQQRDQLFNELPLINDHYRSTPQWLGLYPLLRPIFNWRISRLHEQEKKWFASPQHFDQSQSYGFKKLAPLASTEVENWFEAAYENTALKIPELEDNQIDRLIKQHAPSFVIETLGDHDRLGSPAWINEQFNVDTAVPTTYSLASYTRFNNQNLLQLSYVVWFPRRIASSALDLYSGEFDSLIWRVTFDAKGQVLLYDSIHSCGCYHKYFIASDKLAVRTPPASSEPANIFQLDIKDFEVGLQLVLNSNEHFVVGIEAPNPSFDQNYQLEDYSALYFLDAGSRLKSLFSESGIIQGSERLERFTLWPTGIESVGAMRQWGTHATGFVERQHFDDATLFDHYFVMNLSPEN